MKDQLETIENIDLIENNLVHFEFELERNDTSYFRIAREAHQVFYRAMVEVLQGSSNITVTGRASDKNRSVKYRIGISNLPILEIHKEKIEGCKTAWRYSIPTPYQKLEKLSETSKKTKTKIDKNYLKNFYDLLAMIQTKCFMSRYMLSAPITISDNEMQILEWLHENIRNPYEHFVPTIYSAPTISLLKASLICIDKSKKLIFDSGFLFEPSKLVSIKNLIRKIILKIQQLIQ